LDNKVFDTTDARCNYEVQHFNICHPTLTCFGSTNHQALLYKNKIKKLFYYIVINICEQVISH